MSAQEHAQARSRLLRAMSGVAVLSVLGSWSLGRCGREPGTDAVVSATELLAVPECPVREPPVRKGSLASSELDEVSGLVASHTQQGVFWAHNDSGDRARVFAITVEGRVLAEVQLGGLELVDAEDIALGPGPHTGVDYLYLADTGNNWRWRDSVRIHRIEEPLIAQDGSHEKLVRAPFSIEVSYEDGPHDSETLLVDGQTGDLYLVAKRRLLTREWNVGVYRLPAEELQTQKVRARRVATIGLGPVTAGDMTADGSVIMVRNYHDALYWKRGPGQTVAQAFMSPACALPLAEDDHQGEALALLPDGSGYVTTSEGASAPLFLTHFSARAFTPSPRPR